MNWLRPALVSGSLALALVLGVAMGAFLRELSRGPIVDAIRALSAAERTEASAEVDAALNEAAWRLGSADYVEARLLLTLAQVSESNPGLRAKILFRLALISDNPEGQSAIFSQICGLLEPICDHQGRLRELASKEAELRIVGPGNRLPLILLGIDHPPIGP